MTEKLNHDESLSSDDIHSFIKAAISKLGPQYSKEEKKEHGKLLIKIFEKGLTPQQAMKITDEEIAQIYSFAYHQFAGEKYAEARELFKMLLTLDPYNSEFATALGVCHHRLKNYEYALQCYMLNALLAPKNPVALFYAYDCFVNLKDEVTGAVMLNNVIARAGDQPAFAKLKKDAQALLEPLQKKLTEEQASVNSKSS